jgi:hypothetical protein
MTKLAAAVVITSLALVGSTSGARAADVATPAVSGPIEGGERGRPFTSAVVDLAAHGYVEEEFFLDGTATTYAPAPGTALGSDGGWELVPDDALPFRTRILVRRPTSASRFNGTVLVEWLNVTGGFDIDAVWARIQTEALREGYAWVGVSAQRASVNGPPVLEGISDPLTTWDPERYGTLSIPDDAASYDLFSQTAAVLGRDRPRGSSAGPDPLDGLQVRRLLAIGASQSAHRLASYVDGVHPLVRRFDGFLVVGRFGRGASLGPGSDAPSPLRMRTDLATPVFTVNSESEAIAHFAARQPDTGSLRYWEVAGAAHQDTYVDAVIDAETSRDLGFPLPPCTPPANSMPFQYVLNAALDHLNRWAAGIADGRARRRRLRSLPPGANDAPRAIRSAGTAAAPPAFPPIAISGEPPAIERDGFGNARGGIRLPQLRVPTAQYGPVGTPELLRCDLRGFTIPFSDETLAALYPDHATYVRRVDAATQSALRSGIVLPPDAREIRREAAAAPVP